MTNGTDAIRYYKQHKTPEKKKNTQQNQNEKRCISNLHAVIVERGVQEKNK